MKKTFFTQSILKVLDRDLNKVIHELQSYENEIHIWSLSGSINNTGGNLALHIAGAINHFIGAVLGKSSYVREREKEFSLKDLNREEVLAKVKSAIETLHKVLPGIQKQELENEFPEILGGTSMTKGFFLVHLVSHINYHLGQINYHRRLLDSKR